MKSLSNNKYLIRFRHALQGVAVVGCILLSACSGSSGGVIADNNDNLFNAIVLEKSATIPVLDGKVTTAGIYVRNTTDETISGISYALALSDSQTSLKINADSCHSIAANSSCLLSLTTPALTNGNSGNNILVAYYNDGQQSKQLINYRYVDTNAYDGISFSDNSQTLFGTDDYATVYVFAAKAQNQNNVGFTVSNNSLAIANGLTNGKINTPDNGVVALELQSNHNVTTGLVTVTPYSHTIRKNLNDVLSLGIQSNSQLEVTITPAQQANLLMSDIPVLTNSESTTTLTIFNNGNQIANSLNLHSGGDDVTVTTAETNPCSGSLASGASCNYIIHKNNNYSNGATLLTLAYNNSLIATNAVQTVYYLNNNNEPMISAVAHQTNFTEQVGTNQNITFNLTNIGNVPLDNSIITTRTTLAHTTLTIQNNTCTTTIAANSSCLLQVNVVGSSLIDSGVIYLNIAGSYAGTIIKSYSFMSKPVYAKIIDTSNPTVTSTTPPDSATIVATTTGIVVNFSESMIPTTLNNSNIQLQRVSDSSTVPLTLQGVSSNNQQVTFSQSSGTLADNTQYKVVINPSQIKDINGNSIGTATLQTVAIFTTGDATAPTISSVAPINGSNNLSQSPSISIIFSEAMNQNNMTTGNIILKTQAGAIVTGTSINYNPATFVAIVNLNGVLLNSQTTYQLYVNEQNLTDMFGNSIGSNASALQSQFTIGDYTAPTLSSIVPVNGATNVAAESAISLTFSEAMDTATLITPNIQLKKVSDGVAITLNSPTYSNGNKTVTFQPSTNLIGGESYNIVINPSLINDAAGNVMGAPTAQTVSNFSVPLVITGISLPQSGQLYCVPGASYTTNCGSGYTSVAGTDGYGRIFNSNYVPYGVVWAYNSGEALNPATRFTAGTGAESNCITDNLTGLMWFKTPGTTSTWSNAQTVISNYNTNKYCGHDDWYLPTVNDLNSLVNDGATTNSWLIIQGFSNVQSFEYWSSSTVASNVNNAWTVALDVGTVRTRPKSEAYYVWPVRLGGTLTAAPAKVPATGGSNSVPVTGAIKGVAWPSPRFIAESGSAAECITDKLTGLMWPKNGTIGFISSGELLNQPLYNNTTTNLNNLTWSQALTAVGKMNTATNKLCGYTDWRLPNKVELKSLINYGAAKPSSWLMYGAGSSAAPTCYGACFANVQENYYWSSTTLVSNTSYAWFVAMSSGALSGIEVLKTVKLPVWPVRGGR